MDNLYRESTQIIDELIKKLNSTDWGKDYVEEILSYRDDLEKPCILAIAGQVSAGKSSLINALLGFDFAIVGSNETTAVLTYFKYGRKSPSQKVRCVYKNGSESYESTKFLLDAQGFSTDSSDIVNQIDYFEVFIDNPLLKDIIFVDTPGTGSAIREHEIKTREIIKIADAFLYLFGYTANEHNLEYIETFKKVSSADEESMNILGIVTKIDKNDNVLNNSKSFTQKIKHQFKGKVNHVVGVSAALYQAVNSKSEDDLKEIQKKLKRISEDDSWIIDDRDFFEDEECGLELRDRLKISKEFPDWIIFRTVAKYLYHKEDSKNLKDELICLSGFPNLKVALESQILERSKYIVCYKVAIKLHQWLNSLQREKLTEIQKLETNQKGKREQFINFLRNFNNKTAEDLLHFIENSSELVSPEEEATIWLEKITTKLEILISKLVILNNDLKANILLLEDKSNFSKTERIELSQLFGKENVDFPRRITALNQFEINNFQERQRNWRGIKLQYQRGSNIHIIAENAEIRYGNLIEFKKNYQYEKKVK